MIDHHWTREGTHGKFVEGNGSLGALEPEAAATHGGSDGDTELAVHFV